MIFLGLSVRNKFIPTVQFSVGCYCIIIILVTMMMMMMMMMMIIEGFIKNFNYKGIYRIFFHFTEKKNITLLKILNVLKLGKKYWMKFFGAILLTSKFCSHKSVGRIF